MNHRHVFTLSLLSGVMATSLAFSIPPKEDNQSGSSSQVVVPVQDVSAPLNDQHAHPATAAASNSPKFADVMAYMAEYTQTQQAASSSSQPNPLQALVPEELRRFKLPNFNQIMAIVEFDVFETNPVYFDTEIIKIYALDMADQIVDRSHLKNRFNSFVFNRLKKDPEIKNYPEVIPYQEKYLQEMVGAWMNKIILASTPIDMPSQAASSQAVVPQGAPSRDKDRDLLDISNIDDYLPRCGELLHCLPTFLSETPLKAGQIYRLALQQFLEASVSAKLKELIEDGEESDEDDRKDIESQKPKFHKLIQILLDDLPILGRTKLPEDSDASEV